jgi:xylulokinase
MLMLGLDIGTSATKALLLAADGEVWTAEATHDLHCPRPGWAEQDPAQWWHASLTSMKKVLRKARRKASEITAIGLSGQMHGSVFLGDSPQPLRPAILWNDQRTSAQCRQIQDAAGGREALVAMVSNPALTGFTAPKILWLMQNEPRRYAKVRHILLPKDYIRYCLTGQYVTDVADASGTLLLDVKTRSWCTALIDKLGIDAGLLPVVMESTDISGVVTQPVAGLTGLRAGTPVVAGAGDQAAGAVGAGVVAPGVLSATIGTSGVIFAAADKPLTDPQGRIHTMCHAIKNTWCLFGCMLSAGGSYQWMRNLLQSAGGKSAAYSYDQLNALAQAVPPGADRLLFLPYLTGERCPHADPNARGCFIGLTPSHRAGHMVRAVMEGVTLGMRQQVQMMRGLGVEVKDIRAGGGGSRSEFWLQMQADMYGAVVSTIRVDQGAALGAAILAGVGTGVWPGVPEATAMLVKTQKKFRPNSRRVDFYNQLSARYEMLYPALAPAFESLSTLPDK